VNTKQGLRAGRRRRHHSAEFKAKVVEECRGAGVSLAAVALAHGLNANLLRRWAVENKSTGRPPGPASTPPQQEFVALPWVAPAPQPVAACDIRVELRRGATTITISWPAQAASDCAAWLREWRR
jgi:transposase-like protein